MTLTRKQWSFVLMLVIFVSIITAVPLILWKTVLTPRTAHQAGGANPLQTVTAHWVAAESEPVITALCRWQGQLGGAAKRLLLPDIIAGQKLTAAIDRSGDIGPALADLQAKLPRGIVTTPPVIWHDGTIGFMGSEIGGEPQEVFFKTCP